LSEASVVLGAEESLGVRVVVSGPGDSKCPYKPVLCLPEMLFSILFASLDRESV